VKTPQQQQQTVKQKFKMVNTLRLGLSKFDEVITPEMSKIKKAINFADKENPSI
jgi:hypothetical protein